MMLICHLLLILYLLDGQLGLEMRENLPSLLTIANNWTSAGLLVSRAKDAINVEDLVQDLVKINHYQSLAANVEFLEGNACTIIEA